MNRFPALRSAAALAFVLLSASARISHSDSAGCPTSIVQFPSAVRDSFALAAFDSTWYTLGDRVSWDLPAGRVFMHSAGWLGPTLVQARDAFDVAGVPAGTPVSLTAVFTVDGLVGTAGCGGSGCAGVYDIQILHGGEVQEVYNILTVYQGEVHHHDDVQLPVTIVAGTPEVIGFQLYGRRAPGGSHYEEATGTISFTGLPPGARVVSCEGFGGITPVTRRSWGALKSIYR